MNPREITWYIRYVDDTPSYTVTKHELEHLKHSSWHFDEHHFYIILNFGGGPVPEHEVIENTPD